MGVVPTEADIPAAARMADRVEVVRTTTALPMGVLTEGLTRDDPMMVETPVDVTTEAEAVLTEVGEPLPEAAGTTAVEALPAVAIVQALDDPQVAAVPAAAQPQVGATPQAEAALLAGAAAVTLPVEVQRTAAAAVTKK